MFRRLLASLLLVGYFAGQLATMPHAHAAWDPEHDDSAHIHSGWLTRWFESDGHTHGCAGHTHGKQSGPEDSETRSQEPHEHDCILLPTPVAASSCEQDSTTTAEVDHVAAIFAISAPAAYLHTGAASQPASLPEPASPAALYLVLRTLRI